VLALNERAAFAVSLTGGQAHGCPNGIDLLVNTGERFVETDLAVDKACKSKEFRLIAPLLGYNVVSPPPVNAKEHWEYDKEKYKERNRIERLFGGIKRRFRKVFTRFDKLDVIYLAFVFFALIMELLRFSVNTL